MTEYLFPDMGQQWLDQHGEGPMKFRVEVEITSRRMAELTIYAPDEAAALEKAEGIVRQWDNVTEVEAISAEEKE